MAITREKKEQLVALYKEQIENSTALVFTDYRGASVAQMNGLRARLRTTDTNYMVAKNNLLQIALQQSGRDLDLAELMEGPNAIAFVGEDIGKGVKTLTDWIREAGEVIQIRGGVLESEVLNATQTASLADLPTREEMLAKLLSTIMAPASQLVRTINEPGASLARVLQARIDQQQEAA